MIRRLYIPLLFAACWLAPGPSDLFARRDPVMLPDPYYPQKPVGELRLNYYYDRTGRWVKFSDWIPNRRHRWEPRYLEEFYQLYGLPPGYNVPEIKESIFFLFTALSARFRHPSQALCTIQTEDEHHRYRNLMFMHINALIMRMYLRLGSLYDKRVLRYHDLDVADDLEVSFRIARTYYTEARIYWEKAKSYADAVGDQKFEVNMPQLESEQFQIRKKKLNFDYDRIIDRHIDAVDKKLAVVTDFLDAEGRPRPVKVKMLEDIQKMYDKDFTPDPLEMPQLNQHWNEKEIFKD